MKRSQNLTIPTFSPMMAAFGIDSPNLCDLLDVFPEISHIITRRLNVTYIFFLGIVSKRMKSVLLQSWRLYENHGLPKHVRLEKNSLFCETSTCFVDYHFTKNSEASKMGFDFFLKNVVYASDGIGSTETTETSTNPWIYFPNKTSSLVKNKNIALIKKIVIYKIFQHQISTRTTKDYKTLTQRIASTKKMSRLLTSTMIHHSESDTMKLLHFFQKNFEMLIKNWNKTAVELHSNQQQHQPLESDPFGEIQIPGIIEHSKFVWKPVCDMLSIICNKPMLKAWLISLDLIDEIDHGQNPDLRMTSVPSIRTSDFHRGLNMMTYQNYLDIKLNHPHIFDMDFESNISDHTEFPVPRVALDTDDDDDDDILTPPRTTRTDNNTTTVKLVRSTFKISAALKKRLFLNSLIDAENYLLFSELVKSKFVPDNRFLLIALYNFNDKFVTFLTKEMNVRLGPNQISNSDDPKYSDRFWSAKFEKPGKIRMRVSSDYASKVVISPTKLRVVLRSMKLEDFEVLDEEALKHYRKEIIEMPKFSLICGDLTLSKFCL